MLPSSRQEGDQQEEQDTYLRGYMVYSRKY